MHLNERSREVLRLSQKKTRKDVRYTFGKPLKEIELDLEPLEEVEPELEGTVEKIKASRLSTFFVSGRDA